MSIAHQLLSHISLTANEQPPVKPLPKKISTYRLPLRPRQINVDLRYTQPRLKTDFCSRLSIFEKKSLANLKPLKKLNKSTDFSTNVRKPNSRLTTNHTKTISESSLLDKHCTEETIEIKEIRRKPNGEGHTVHRYLRGKVLGKGGFAKVYMLKSLDTNRSYAVKIVPKANLVKARARSKLQSEIRIHRTLKDKHICEYKHFFEDRNNCYLLLELCHNQSLNELLKKRKRLTEPEVKYFLFQLLESVRYLHGKNIIHRDLKLGNLFLDKNLRIKVGDLGLATKLNSPNEKRKTICGTPNYIAPEVIDSDNDKRGHSFEVDIWSMGVILYTLLIGKPPYESKDVKSTYQRILANKYSFPTHIYISEHSRDLISSLLQLCPTKRPSLQQIASHPFFTHETCKIPQSLPSCCIYIAPQWKEDENGKLIPVMQVCKKKIIQSNPSNNSIESNHSAHNNRPSLIDCENHISLGKHKSVKPFISIVPNCKDKLPCVNKYCLQTKTPHFADILEEKDSHSHLHHKQDVMLNGNNIPSENVNNPVSVTSKCKLNEFVYIQAHSGNIIDSTNIKDHKQKGSTNLGLTVLQKMHNRLSEFVKNPIVEECNSNPSHQSSTNPLGANRWITRYVDYSSKYGLGFLLNDRSSGVHFNDSTKIVLLPDDNYFFYIERKKPIEDDIDKCEHIYNKYTLNSYPCNLRKKVTLLKHFRNYLTQHNYGRNKLTSDNGTVCPHHNDDGYVKNTVFLKKWVRTKHAILFRLSNRTVQVVFHDRTEILICSDGRVVTYVDKNCARKSYYLSEIVKLDNRDTIKRRLKYIKDTLGQLVIPIKSL